MSPAHQTGGAAKGPAPAGDEQPLRLVSIFTIIALALMMMSVDSTIVATALHDLQHELRTSINWAGWTITAYSFGYVLMLPITGRLTELYGRRRVFLWSVSIFTVASLFCGLADNIYMLIVLRALQAAGGAGFTPAATGIVVEHFGHARDRAVSLFGSIFPIGAMIGPIFGGLFVTYWSWRGVFFVNVPIGVAILLLAPHYIPRDRQQIEHPKLSTDGLGMVLLGIGLLAGMLAASGFGEKGLSPVSPMIVASLAVAVAAFWRFFRHLSRAAEPFIAPHLIYGRGFGAVNLVNGFYGGITGGTIALIPLYATNRYGLDALASGTLLVAEGAAAIALAVVAALALRKTGNRRPLYAGSVITALGIVLLALNPVGGISPYAWLAGSAFLVGAGGGMANPAGRNAGLQLAPEHSGVIAALRSMSMQVGSITTISVATALLARSANPGMMQAWFFFAAAALCIVGLPMIRRVPEHFGSW